MTIQNEMMYDAKCCSVGASGNPLVGMLAGQMLNNLGAGFESRSVGGGEVVGRHTANDANRGAPSGRAK